eukprot:2094607-Pleurochrysis_carterae.AAC.1
MPMDFGAIMFGAAGTPSATTAGASSGSMGANMSSDSQQQPFMGSSSFQCKHIEPGSNTAGAHMVKRINARRVFYFIRVVAIGSV